MTMVLNLYFDILQQLYCIASLPDHKIVIDIDTWKQIKTFIENFHLLF